MSNPGNILKMTPTKTPTGIQKSWSVIRDQDYILYEIKYMFYSRQPEHAHQKTAITLQSLQRQLARRETVFSRSRGRGALPSDNKRGTVSLFKSLTQSLKEEGYAGIKAQGTI